MKNKWIILMLAILVAMPAVSFANHERSGGDSLENKYFGKVHFLFQNKNELGLSDEQLDQIKTIKFETKRAMIDAEAKKDLAALDIYEELHKDQPDVNKIDALIDQKHAAKSGLSKTVVRSLVNTKAVLSAEQQAKAKELYYKN